MVSIRPKTGPSKMAGWMLLLFKLESEHELGDDVFLNLVGAACD